jgi:hypothetical protein
MAESSTSRKLALSIGATSSLTDVAFPVGARNMSASKSGARRSSSSLDKTLGWI